MYQDSLPVPPPTLHTAVLSCDKASKWAKHTSMEGLKSVVLHGMVLARNEYRYIQRYVSVSSQPPFNIYIYIYTSGFHTLYLPADRLMHAPPSVRYRITPYARSKMHAFMLITHCSLRIRCEWLVTFRVTSALYDSYSMYSVWNPYGQLRHYCECFCNSI
jgi:hypothetical protein